MSSDSISRREFGKLAVVGLGSILIPPMAGLHGFRPSTKLSEFPQAERLGRVLAGRVPIKKRPDIDSPDVGTLYEDDVVVWLREVVGSRPLWNSQRFIETPDGYLYAANIQPVKNLPNQPLEQLPEANKNGGMWVEVSVPYADLTLDNPPARSPWLKGNLHPRVYYSQILWVDQIKNDSSGQIQYRVKELYGSYGDIFWVQGAALRPLQPEEFTPIHPEVEDKTVVVDVTYQTLSCYEGKDEIYFTRVSTGDKFDAQGNPVDKWSTPVGPHHIWRKMVSVHMSGGTTGGGYDLPGIGWTSLFSGNGVAIHSTFWHNNFGVPMSHGCVNARPHDAEFVFRWTAPTVPADTGDVTISGTTSTEVVVIEG
ncbi:MAG: L,D-transpeptidase [Anaerolineales bacterium]